MSQTRPALGTSSTDAPSRAPLAPVALGAGSTYVPHRAPLAPAAFAKLPPGSIKPRGWLRQQLELQLEGLNGRLPDLSDYLVYETNGWVDSDKAAWEELPYWLRGFGNLGYATGDERVLALTRKWVEGILATLAPDGFFGPSRLRTSLEGGPDFWPHMPLLNVLRSFAEYHDDDRIVAFLTSYFRFQNAQPAEVFGRSWGSFRCGDNLDSIFWLYNRTGDAWLLDLARKVHEGSADYVSGIPNWHNVNLAQGFREPLQYGVLASDPALRAATYRNYDTIMRQYGQFPGGGFAGDENSRPGYDDPRQGFETCGIVEFMHSFELLTRLTGDPVWADRCEELAFNSLPASLDPDGKLIHYVTCANCVQLDDALKTRGQFENYFPLLAYLPGIHNEPVAYRCCPHNYGMGWPYFAEELWLSTPDGGLCASMYAASEVSAVVADGVSVRVVADTDYPFLETVDLVITPSREVEFPLWLRIPGWCSEASVRVNGAEVSVDAAAGSYARVVRTWAPGDRVSLRLPMSTSVRTWAAQGDAVSVDRGPLTYSLAIAERWESYAGTEPTPGLQVFPESPWNYGLALASGPEAGRGVRVRQRRRSTEGVNPFTPAGTPVELSVRARLLPGWQADPEGVVRPLQQSPALSTEPETEVRLIPMGAARLRITTFPRLGPDGVEWRVPDLATASHCWRGDSVDALNDGVEPSSSNDHTIPRLTWWDHVGTAEWVQYSFATPRSVSGVSVYWFDDTGLGACRVPASWRVLSLADDSWVSVTGASAYGVDRDRYNEVTFDQVTTSGLRLEVQLQPNVSGGILEWKLDPPPLGQ